MVNVGEIRLAGYFIRVTVLPYFMSLLLEKKVFLLHRHMENVCDVLRDLNTGPVCETK